MTGWVGSDRGRPGQEVFKLSRVRSGPTGRVRSGVIGHMTGRVGSDRVRPGQEVFQTLTSPIGSGWVGSP